MQSTCYQPDAGGSCQLQLEEVSKICGGRVLVDAVSLNVRQGEVVGIVGPNGAGKSTTFNIMIGKDRPSRGRVLFRSSDITQLPLPKRCRLGIGYMPQESSIFRGLSVRDNLLLILQETGVPEDKQEKKMQAPIFSGHFIGTLSRKSGAESLVKHCLQQHLLAECCLTHVEKTSGHLLSGGERRRTELARVLASNSAGGPPKILLLDEPFAGVDPIGVGEMQRQLRRLCDVEGMGVLITDHKVKETLSICNRAYMMHKGRIMASGEPELLYTDKYVQEFYLGADFRVSTN